MNARLSRVRLAHVDDHEAMRRGLAAILDDHPEFRLVVFAVSTFGSFGAEAQRFLAEVSRRCGRALLGAHFFAVTDDDFGRQHRDAVAVPDDGPGVHPPQQADARHFVNAALDAAIRGMAQLEGRGGRRMGGRCRR